jgi:hypothetical protein
MQHLAWHGESVSRAASGIKSLNPERAWLRFFRVRVHQAAHLIDASLGASSTMIYTFPRVVVSILDERVYRSRVRLGLRPLPYKSLHSSVHS